ncbi:MAG: hypothetical protein WD772_01045 [Pseudohongiellaceae bacterium]
MDHVRRSQNSNCLPVSLWQGTELLGWFRAKDIDNEGMLVTGPVERLEDSSIITVSIELKQQNSITTHLVKALVMHPKNNSVELWWADQQSDLRTLVAKTSQLSA